VILSADQRGISRAINILSSSISGVHDMSQVVPALRGTDSRTYAVMMSFNRDFRRGLSNTKDDVAHIPVPGLMNGTGMQNRDLLERCAQAGYARMVSRG